MTMNYSYKRRQWLRHMHTVEMRDVEWIAIYCGVSKDVIKEQMGKFEIPVRPDPPTPIWMPESGKSEKRHQDRDWLYQKYVVEEWSTTDMGKSAGVSDHTIRTWLRKFGIPIRSMSEAMATKSKMIKQKHRNAEHEKEVREGYYTRIRQQSIEIMKGQEKPQLKGWAN
jgi:hypothetical protein